MFVKEPMLHTDLQFQLEHIENFIDGICVCMSWGLIYFQSKEMVLDNIRDLKIQVTTLESIQANINPFHSSYHH